MAKQLTKRQKRHSAVAEAQAEQRNQQAADEYRMENVKFHKRIEFHPKTDNQKTLATSVRSNEVTVAIGPAGVGKTYTVASLAAQMICDHQIDKIILTRANETVGKSIGMLPGTLEEKMTPLLLPILNVLRRQLGDAVYEYCLRKKKIEMLPFEYVRGLSFKDTFVIVDEAQNLKPDDVVAVCTRFESGRTVLMGDPFQHDLQGEPGISWLEKFARRNDIGIPVVKFGLDDIVRSDFVKKFLTALYSEKDNKSKPVAALLG
jgi:phosphate starvation-inducible PhoH-like protein